MSEEQIYQMYRLLVLAKYEERYVIPTAYAVEGRQLEETGCSLSFDGGPGMYESGPFWEASGGPVPVARRDLPRSAATADRRGNGRER